MRRTKGTGISKIQFKELQVKLDQFFSSPEYLENVKRRITDGDAPGLEIHLMNMVYGKPKETLDVKNAGDGVFILHIGGKASKAQEIAEGEVKALEPHVIDGEAERIA